MNTRAGLMGAILVALTALPAGADPILVTGGTVQVEVSLSSARLMLEGDDFFLSVATGDFFAGIAGGPFPFATPADLGGEWQPTDLRAGEAFVNGVHYPEVYIGFGQSQGTFTTPPVDVSGAGTTLVTAPFSFMGTVTAFANASALPADAPLFTLQLNGVGIATARFQILPAQGGTPAVYNPMHLEGADYHLRYEFAPVPEPATLLLVGAGLAAAARRRRR